jgi:hypothetical protein
MSNHEIILLLRKLNPYPVEVFTEPTAEEYVLMKKALSKYKLTPDKFFGSWGRVVWNNAVNAMDELLSEASHE